MTEEEPDYRRDIQAIAAADAAEFLSSQLDKDTGGVPPPPVIKISEVSADPVKFDLLGFGTQGATTTPGGAGGGGEPPGPPNCPNDATLYCDTVTKALNRCGYEGFLDSGPYRLTWQTWTYNIDGTLPPDPPGTPCTSYDNHSIGSRKTLDCFDDDYVICSGEGSKNGVPYNSFVQTLGGDGLYNCNQVGPGGSLCCACAGHPDNVVSDTYATDGGCDAIAPCTGTGLIEFFNDELYTIEMLEDNVIANLPAFDEDYDDSPCSSMYSLTLGETNLAIRRLRYKFTFPSHGIACMVRWRERHKNAANDCILDVVRSFLAGVGVTTTPVYQLDEPNENGTISIVYPDDGGVGCT